MQGGIIGRVAVVVAFVLLAPAAAQADIDVSAAGTAVTVVPNTEKNEVSVFGETFGADIIVGSQTATGSGSCPALVNPGTVRCTFGEPLSKVTADFSAGSLFDTFRATIEGDHPEIHYDSNVKFGAGTNSLRLEVVPQTANVVDGGPGRDSVSYLSCSGCAATGLTVRLDGGGGRDQVTHFEIVQGSNGPDHLIGRDGALPPSDDTGFGEQLAGEGGNDTLNGQAGADFLGGGGGDDVLLAVDGEVDQVTCGTGSNDRAEVDASDTVGSDCEIVNVHDHPNVEITKKPPATTDSANATFEFSGPDNTAGTHECRVDAEAFVLCTSPKDFTGLADGQHTFQVRFTPTGEPPLPVVSATWTIEGGQCEVGNAGNARAASRAVAQVGKAAQRARREAGAKPGFGVSAIRPRRAAPGTAIAIRGRGLAATGVRVTMGGRKAKITARAAVVLHAVVPKLKPGKTRVVVRSGKRSATRRLQIVKPFTGKVGAKLEGAAKRGATIGASGGTLTAKGSDGARYVLAIPAGALTEDVAVTMTPVKAFAGMPLTGGDVAGVALAPEGLTFVKPATLTITGAGKSSNKTVGFSQGAGGFTVDAPQSVGSTTVLTIEHFSFEGWAEASEEDIANVLAPLVRTSRLLTRAEVQGLLEVVSLWDDKFSPDSDPFSDPPSFCRRQPICAEAFSLARRSLSKLADAECTRVKAAPSLAAIGTLVDLQGELDLAGDTTNRMRPCIVALTTALAQAAVAAMQVNPLAPFPGDDVGLQADINGNGVISAFEHTFGLIPEFQTLGVTTSGLSAALITGLDKIRTSALSRCPSSDAGAELAEGLTYASKLQVAVAEYKQALHDCGTGIVISPASVTLKPGAQKQFQFAKTDEGDDAVTFSATGGTITEGGLFTAPAEEGTYQVTVTRAGPPVRSATATVTVAACTT